MASDRAGDLEEHVLTANLVMQKLSSVGVPVWIISLDLSKAFDRLAWPSLWEALRAHGVSEHLIWLTQCLYADQVGVVEGHSSYSKEFPIQAGVRQGCVLSARLFASALEWAMSSWKEDTEGMGICLDDDSCSWLKAFV